MKTIDVAFSLDDYKPFFDYPDFAVLSEQAKGTKLEEALEDLRYAWHTASAVHSMPFSLNSMVTRGFNTWAKLRRKDFEDINDKLSVLGLGDRLDLSTLAKEQDEEDVWKGIIEIKDLQLPFMFMQRMAYSHLYFAYEHFLLFCARVAGDLPKLKATDQKGKTFKDVLSKEFDPYVTDLCWSCETIQLVKRARNVIVHNGCKIDKPIGSLRVRDGELQVLPHDVANLFIVLKERVIILVGRALANKRFQ